MVILFAQMNKKRHKNDFRRKFVQFFNLNYQISHLVWIFLV